MPSFRPFAKPGCTVLGLKDANLALAAGMPLPSGDASGIASVGATLAYGEGEHDWAVMAKYQARASGLE